VNDASYRGRSVLITGATGLIGSHLTLRLAGLGADIHAVIPAGEPPQPLLAGLLGQLQVHDGRLEDAAAITRAVKASAAEIVFHLGAQTQVRAARQDPAATFSTNVAGTWHLLEACRLATSRPKAIAVASSDKAYGKSDRLPYVETDPLAGSEPYEASKAMTDILAQTYASSYGLPTRIARCGNVYGAGDQNWDRIVPGTLRSLLRSERPIIRSDGTPVRDYVHVEDVVDAYLLLGSPDIAAGEAFNVSSGEHCSVLDLVERLTRAAGSTLTPEVRSEAAGELAAQYLDTTKITRQLGWRSTRTIAASLPEIVAWYRTVA